MTDAPIASTAPVAPASPETAGPAGRAPRAAKPRAAQGARKPHPVLERLFQLHPKLFGARFLPLKLGAYQDLLARHPEAFKKEELKLALGLHARSTRYLESVASGDMRHDLDGLPVEPVAPEHVHHAILEVWRRRQARTKDDMRPWLHERLARAVQASGLEREAYLEKVPSPDEQVAVVLDEVFEALAQKAAKREALRRAFESSGCTPEAFADMYGLEVSAVREALDAGATAAKAATDA